MQPATTGRPLAGVLIVALIASLSFDSLVAAGARNEASRATATSTAPPQRGLASSETGGIGA